MNKPAKKSAAKKVPKHTPLPFNDVVQKLLDTPPGTAKRKGRG
jgi:hypothetical protein